MNYLPVTHYRRRLPHLYEIGRPIFLTWRLHGSLPPTRFFENASVTSGRAFVAMDKLLDLSESGPVHLRQPRVAKMVVEAIQYNSEVLGHFSIHSFVVMPNHVHLLITPLVALPALTKSLKGITARRGNEMLNLTGKPFWQDESYDHCVRSDEGLARIRRYIELNPVRIGLARNVEQYPWSSAFCGV